MKSSLSEECFWFTVEGTTSLVLAGRKAAACSVVPDYCISIGVEILKKEVKMIAINLYGEKIRHMAYEIDFEIMWPQSHWL